ncbi:hypothetical protein ABK905_13095 [Acerihabitans sp. KWT182]|uniref:Uncharacterized protein n=1 Tax=Acerihabitans sp. KWT182 TaxID=3157919 RepID=A0AAU7QFQ1_9GAMM
MLEKLHYFYLMDALKRPFPKQPGDYLGVGQYPLLHDVPWADSIGPGDIVTSYPTFWGVSARDFYAKKHSAQADSEGHADIRYRQAMVFFKIEGAQQCIPLITDFDSGQAIHFTEEAIKRREYIYQPNMFFKVKSIATAYMMEGDIHPTQRIGVVLEEFIGPVIEAKNLYTGEALPVTQPEWTRRANRYHMALLS